MPHAFDGPSFSRVLADAERLAGSAIDHERRLTELVGLMERTAPSRANGSTRYAWLEAIRHMCVAARAQRESAQGIVNLLASAVERGADANHARGRVLIVDDCADNREIAAVVLESSGFQTTTTSNGL